MPGPTLAGSSQALDSSLNTIISEFKMLRDETGVCRKTATTYTLDPHTGVSKNVLNYGRVTAYDLADGVDMAQAQTLADTNTAYTPNEAGCQVLLPKSTMRRVADPDLLRRTGRIMNNAYDLKEDADGALQFASFVPIVGAAGTVVRVGHILAATSRVRIGNNRANPEPAPAPWFTVLHPLVGGVIAGRLIPLTDVPSGATAYTPDSGTAGQTIGPGRSSFSDDLIKNGPRAAGRLFDTEVYFDANLVVDSNDDCSGAVYSKEALIYVTEVEPMMEPDERDASARAIELNLWGSFAWGLYRSSAYGCEVLTDASLPTS